MNGVLDPLWPIILHPSDVFDLDLPGFQVGSEVDLFLRSAPVELGSRTAGSDGWVRTSLQFPDDVEPGVHRVIARGVAPSGVEMTHTVFVEVPGQPTPGTVVGIHETGFEPFERVQIEFLGTDFGPVVADERGVMFVEVPVTVLAATQPVALVLAGESGRVVERTISAVPDPVCESLEATIVGTGLDVIEGTNGRDVIVTGHGDDVIRGLNGDDVICSGPGNGRVEGGNGDDLIDLGTGDDVGFGQNGKDELHGGAGNDTLEGENGQDTLDGGPGIDLIDGGRSRDVCTNGETLVDCE